MSITVEVHDSAPAGGDFGEWDEVVDFDFACVSGSLLVTSLLGPMERELPDLASCGAGRYRIRVAARGRDSGPAHYDSHAPDEEFLILSWPAYREEGEHVHKRTDRYGAHLRRNA
ncbi:hypothetical protein [Actinokineospora sp. NPDC004072]